MPARPVNSMQLSLFDETAAAPPSLPPGLPPRLAPAPPAPPQRLPPQLMPPQAAFGPPRSTEADNERERTPSTATEPVEFRHPHSQRRIVLDGHAVGYALRRSRRHSIGFVIGAEGLSVSAPRWVGSGEIDTALREKAGWILRKLHEQRERARRLDSARVDWRAGTLIPFLGRPVELVLDAAVSGAVLHTPDPADALSDRLQLRLGLPASAEPVQIRDTVQSWLQRQARRVFEERCALFAPRLAVRMKRLSLSSAATRWGSASADGSIRLNWRLVHFALPVIDYVVTHELAHLREMNHGPAFWDVVRTALPDYEAARGVLRSEVLPVFD